MAHHGENEKIFHCVRSLVNRSLWHFAADGIIMLYEYVLWCMYEMDVIWCVYELCVIIYIWIMCYNVCRNYMYYYVCMNYMYYDACNKLYIQVWIINIGTTRPSFSYTDWLIIMCSLIFWISHDNTDLVCMLLRHVFSEIHNKKRVGDVSNNKIYTGATLHTVRLTDCLTQTRD